MILFSLGVGQFDTQPTQLQCADFNAFCEGISQAIRATVAVMRTDEEYLRSKHEIQWVTVAFSDAAGNNSSVGKRSNPTAGGRYWIALDADRCTQRQFVRLERRLRDYDALLYTTLGDRRKGPDDRRCRILINVNRPMQPAEVAWFSGIVARELSEDIPWDTSVYTVAQPLFLSHSEAQIIRTAGRVIDIDQMEPAPLVERGAVSDREHDVSSLEDYLESIGAHWDHSHNGYKFCNPNPIDYSSSAKDDDFLVQMPSKGSYDMIGVRLIHDSDKRKGWETALTTAGYPDLVDLIKERNQEIRDALSVPVGTVAHIWRRKENDPVPADESPETTPGDAVTRPAAETPKDAVTPGAPAPSAPAEGDLSPELIAEMESSNIADDINWMVCLSPLALVSRAGDSATPPKYRRVQSLIIKHNQNKRKQAQALSDAIADKAEQEEQHKPGSVSAIMADHPLAMYSANVARVMQMPLDTTLLIALGVASAVCSLTYTVKTSYAKQAPIGLYVMAEQPPAARKSATLGAFKDSLFIELGQQNNQRREDIAKELMTEDGVKPSLEQRERAKALPQPIVGLPLTDATAEALESKSMVKNGGLFSLMSDEKRLVDTLFDDDKKNNFAALLAGYDGGYINSARVTRDGFSGRAHGSIIAFAQDGLIDTVMRNADGTGIAERFIFIAEPSLLGRRVKQTTAQQYIDSEQWRVFVQYLIFTKLPHSTELNDKGGLPNHVSLYSHRDLVDDYLYGPEVEGEMSEGGKFENRLLAGMAGKQSLLIAKLSAILHIYRFACKSQEPPEEIGERDVKMAMELAKKLLDINYRTLAAIGLVGAQEEHKVVLEILGEAKAGAMDATSLAKAMRNRSPFRKNGRRAALTAMLKVLDDMINSGVVSGDRINGKIHTVRTLR